MSEQKRQQILAHGRLNWSLRQIEEAVGLRRETASAYLKAAGVAIRTQRGRCPPAKAASQAITDPGADSNPASQVSTDPWTAKPASEPEVSTDFVPTQAPPAAAAPGLLGAAPPPPVARAPSASACEPYRELIEEAHCRGRNAMAIYQDLVDQHGFTAKYASVKRFVNKLAGGTTPEARAVIQTAAGEEGQVDYGEGPMVREPKTGKYRRTRLFVMTLGYSRKSVRLLTFQSSSRIWAELHQQSFLRLGGSVRVIVLDNLREGVIA